MNVKELKSKLLFLLKYNYIKEVDEILIVATNKYKTDIINLDLVMPVITKVEKEIEDHINGLSESDSHYGIGFYRKKD